MVTQSLVQLVPNIALYDENRGVNDPPSPAIDGVDILSVNYESSAKLATHPGEDGTVYSDTRVRMPARYRAQIVVPETTNQAIGKSDAVMNLLDASWNVMCRYTLTSFFTTGYNFVVISSHTSDTTEMTNLRIQEVVFEECLEHDKEKFSVTSSPASASDTATVNAPVQSVMTVADIEAAELGG